MLKKTLIMFVTFTLLLSNINMVHAKTKACPVKPTYNIVISAQSVQIVNEEHNLFISPTGLVTLDEQAIALKPAIQNQAKTYQAYLRKQLPIFENQAYWQLNDVRLAFEIAIRDKLGNKSELLQHLNNLHSRLLTLLKKSIVTKDSITYFYYQPFNNLKKDGEAIGEDVIYSILGDSLLHFNIFKNYSAFKKIAKDEWKTQKIILKAFDEHVCELITEMDNGYNQLMRNLD